MSVQVDDAFKTVMKENRRVNTALMLNTEEKNALHPRKRKPDHDDGADDNRAGSDDRGHSTGGNDVTSGLCSADDVPAVRCVQTLAQAMGGVTIMKKGLVDIISNGHTSFYSCKQGQWIHSAHA